VLVDADGNQHRNVANLASDELIDIDVPVVDWRRPLNRGNDLLRKGKPREALEQFKEALHIDPKQAQAHFHVGLALDKLKLRDEAIEHYTKAIELNPQHAPAYNNFGIILGRQGKFDQAIEYFRRALEIEPTSASARINLKHALRK